MVLDLSFPLLAAFIGALAGALVGILGSALLILSTNRRLSIERAEELREMWYDVAYGNRTNWMPWEARTGQGFREEATFDYWRRFVMYGPLVDKDLQGRHSRLRDYLAGEGGEDLNEDDFRDQYHEFRKKAKIRLRELEERIKEIRDLRLWKFWRVVEVVDPQASFANAPEG